jgi:uncharacterized protein (DUF488 family)
MGQPPIFTIGYGAREIDAFLAVLQAHEIAFLIDVRSRPYSRFKPDFSKHALSQHLERVGVHYVFMGDQLGGQPEGAAFRDKDDKILYEEVARQPFYLQGINRVRKAYQQQLRVVLMCSEGKPEQCHRYVLIGNSLDEANVPVIHIDENNEELTQGEVRIRIQKGQLSLPGLEFDRKSSRKRYPQGDDDA